MSFKYTSRHHGWYAAQVPHGTTYVVLTLSLLIRPVWPSTYEELVSPSQKKKDALGIWHFWMFTLFHPFVLFSTHLYFFPLQSSLGRLILRVFPRGVPRGSSGGT